MSNIGKRVRLTKEYLKEQSTFSDVVYTVISEGRIWHIRSEGGEEHWPYGPDSGNPQCELINDEPVNQQWYVRCINAEKCGLHEITNNKEYEIIREESNISGNRYVIVADDGIQDDYYQSRFTPKYQKMNNSIENKIATMEKELSELKEQVRNPYKVGDWVYLMSQKQNSCYLPEHKIGTIAQIQKINESLPLGKGIQVKQNSGNWYVDDIRKATEEEIRKATAKPQEKVVEIGSEKSKIVISKSKIIAPDGKNVAIENVDNIVGIMKDTRGFGGWIIDFNKVDIGCVKEITYHQLVAIQDAYKLLNES